MVLSFLPFSIIALTLAAASGQQATGAPQGALTHSVENAAGRPPAAETAVPASYVITAEDQLQVNVWKEPALSGSFPVRPDGKISIALVGDLRAAGLTPSQLSEDIQQRLKRFMTDPNVTVTVIGVHVDKIYLLGEVGHVGAVPLTAGMTPLQAIAAAGGLTPYANSKHVYVLRTAAGKQQKLPYDYKKALKSGNQQGIALLPNDTIVVP